jgi:hypothetical protein
LPSALDYQAMLWTHDVIGWVPRLEELAAHEDHYFDLIGLPG